MKKMTQHCPLVSHNIQYTLSVIKFSLKKKIVFNYLMSVLSIVKYHILCPSGTYFPLIIFLFINLT